MLSDLRSFNGIFPWQGQPARVRIQNLTAIWLLAGLAGLSLVVYVWAFTLPYNLLEWYPHPRLTPRYFLQKDPLTLWRFAGFFLVQGGLYWLAWRLALQVRGRVAWLIVLGGSLAFSLVLLFLYPVDAADIFDNIMHGRILGVYGANPFRDVANQFADDPFYPYMAWRRTPSAYGPLWEALAGGMARLLAGNGLIANVLAFKLLGGLFLAVGIGLVAVILRRQAPERTLAGVTLLAWNPVVLYETLGNGHNDIAMAIWLLAAAWAVLSRRYTLAVLALLVGALIKFIPLLLLPIAGLIALRHLPHVRARLGFLMVTAISASALIVISYGPFWYGWAALGLGRRALFTASLPAAIHAALHLSLGLKNIGWEIGLVAASLTALFVLWQSWRVWRDPSWPNFTRTSFNILMFYLLVTCLWFQQWYAIWPLTLAALLPPGHAPRLAVLFSFAAMSKHLIAGPLLFWTQPRPPRPWLELGFGPAVMIIPWLYALLALWLVKRTKSADDNVIRNA